MVSVDEDIGDLLRKGILSLSALIRILRRFRFFCAFGTSDLIHCLQVMIIKKLFHPKYPGFPLNSFRHLGYI